MAPSASRLQEDVTSPVLSPLPVRLEKVTVSPLPHCGYLGSPLGTNVWDGWGVCALHRWRYSSAAGRCGSTHLSSGTSQEEGRGSPAQPRWWNSWLCTQPPRRPYHGTFCRATWSDSWVVTNNLVVWSDHGVRGNFLTGGKPTCETQIQKELTESPVSIISTHVSAYTNCASSEATVNNRGDPLISPLYSVWYRAQGTYHSTTDTQAAQPQVTREPRLNDLTTKGQDSPL